MIKPEPEPEPEPDTQTTAVAEPWITSEPPKDGSVIVAVGRVISSDEISTWVDPFCAAIFWKKDSSGYEDWHIHHGQMSVARTLEDKVMIDYWLPYPAKKLN